jgi:hypothetical protein
MIASFPANVQKPQAQTYLCLFPTSAIYPQTLQDFVAEGEEKGASEYTNDKSPF